MAPPIAFTIPYFLAYRWMGLLDTRFGLILIYLTFNISLVVWLMRSFFDACPRSLEEAAWVDGATLWQGFTRIMLPISGPGAAPSLPPERLPHITVGKTSAGRLHLFPDGLPIGVGSNGRVVFLYLVTSPFDTDLRRFLQRHAELLRALPGWTLELLFPRRAGMMSAFENAARGVSVGETAAERELCARERPSPSSDMPRCTMNVPISDVGIDTQTFSVVPSELRSMRKKRPDATSWRIRACSRETSGEDAMRTSTG
jgi:hypothetical protein